MREIILFTKRLCPTDTRLKLVVPTHALPNFNIPNGEHFIYFEATDTIGNKWNFRLSVRRNDRRDNQRPEITGDWKRFISNKRLEEGNVYRVILGKNVDETTGDERFFIRVEKNVFALMGQQIWVDVDKTA